MSVIVITLAVEDILSEIILRKILENTGVEYCVTQCLCKGGSGYLKSKINTFNNAAKGMPFLILADQDNPNTCPATIINNWLNGDQHPNLIFRIAVMEVESWIMAHRNAFSDFLSIPVNRIPNDTDGISNPKQYLLTLANRSRLHRLREDLIPQPGSTASVGPDYNNRLAKFIRDSWDVNEARLHSLSLERAFTQLQNFHPVYDK